MKINACTIVLLVATATHHFYAADMATQLNTAKTGLEGVVRQQDDLKKMQDAVQKSLQETLEKINALKEENTRLKTAAIQSSQTIAAQTEAKKDVERLTANLQKLQDENKKYAAAQDTLTQQKELLENRLATSEAQLKEHSSRLNVLVQRYSHGLAPEYWVQHVKPRQNPQSELYPESKLDKGDSNNYARIEILLNANNPQEPLPE